MNVNYVVIFGLLSTFIIVNGTLKTECSSVGGYFQTGSCYQFVKNGYASYEEAKTECKKLPEYRGHLYWPTNQAVYQNLQIIHDEFSTNFNAWIGLHRLNTNSSVNGDGWYYDSPDAVFGSIPTMDYNRPNTISPFIWANLLYHSNFTATSLADTIKPTPAVIPSASTGVYGLVCQYDDVEHYDRRIVRSVRFVNKKWNTKFTTQVYVKPSRLNSGWCLRSCAMEVACQSYSFSLQINTCLHAYGKAAENWEFIQEDTDFDTFDVIRL